MTASTPDFKSFSEAIAQRDYSSTILCFTASATDDELVASFDLGDTWDRVSTSEVTDAEVVKQVELADASYTLTRLYLTEPHPTIEVAALAAQVRFQRTHGAKDAPWYSCGDVCATKTGCDYSRCLFWCAFLKG